jgi:hypothetical protein
MKLKIFNSKLLLMCALLATAQGGFAQKNKADDKELNQQMSELQKQMSELQRQMSKLQVKTMREKSVEMQKLALELTGQAKTRSTDMKAKALEMQKLARELSSQALVYTNDYNVSGLSKGLGINVDPKLFNSPRVNLESLKGLRTFDFNFNASDDKKLQEQIQKGEVKEKVKNYSKSYSVDGNDKLVINNTYGKVTVNTWAKNEVKVDVQIKAYANEEDDAQKMLDNISITDSKENSVISFKTNIERTNNNNNGNNFWGTWFSNGKSNTRKSEINYTIYMPAKSQLQISNRYGATILPDLQGKLIIENSYGSLTGKNLSNPANDIKVRYGSANIENLGSSNLSVAYGSLNLGEADKLNADVSYSSAKIGKLTTSANINVRYSGGLQIADLDKNLRNLSVNSSYSTVKLGLPENENADIDVTVRYGSFNYGSRTVNLVNQAQDDNRHYSTTKVYKGKLGKGNADKVITIKSNYGSVKFD